MTEPAESHQLADFESTAAAIAERGRETLLERLRRAYSEAAAAHADVLALDEERIEMMVQRAAQRADGLQWRRALASAGAVQLGISVAQALTHPAVTRAQAIAGAPSYEQGLVALRPQNTVGPAAIAPQGAAAIAPEDGYPSAGTPEPQPQPEREHDSDEDSDTFDEDSDTFDEDGALNEDGTPDGRLQRLIDSLPRSPDEVRISARHLGGVADLHIDDRIDLRISGDGFDIIGPDDIVVGRLEWSEVGDLSVPEPVGRRERRRPTTRLVVQTRQGDASFEVAELSREALRERLRPLRAYFQQS
ncbi:MAG: hypothetical protein ACLP0J_12095 [Solirubrobacteraceae bacterium]